MMMMNIVAHYVFVSNVMQTILLYVELDNKTNYCLEAILRIAEPHKSIWPPYTKHIFHMLHCIFQTWNDFCM